MTDEAGRELREGRYVVSGVLGEGAQGATLEAVDKRDGKLVAIKRFMVRGAKAWKDVELAEREARVLSQIDHPALPKLVDHFEEDGALYLVMEKIEGETLHQRRKSGDPITEDDVVRFLQDAADVLAYLHARRPPIIHRDIKPGNVIRRPDGSHVFVDFGSVRDTLKPEGGSTVVGTFGYMAPEQFQGRALPASDVYAVGATALSLLTSREPEDLPHQGLALDVQKALGGVASPGLIRALSAMLVPNPDERATDLRALLQQTGARPRPRSSEKRREASPRARRRERRRAPPPAPLFRGVFFFGLLFAQLAVFVTMRVAVPLLLSVLSILFGSGLARAAASVSKAGETAARRLAAAQRWAMGKSPDRRREPAPPPEQPRQRVAPSPTGPAGRVRVVDVEGLEVEPGYEVEAEAPATRVRARR